MRSVLKYHIGFSTFCVVQGITVLSPCSELDHVLIEVLKWFRLKWLQVWKVYTLSFLVLALFMVAMVGLTMLRYSHNLDSLDNKEQWVTAFSVLLLISTILLSCLQVAKLQDLLYKHRGGKAIYSSENERFLGISMTDKGYILPN